MSAPPAETSAPAAAAAADPAPPPAGRSVEVYLNAGTELVEFELSQLAGGTTEVHEIINVLQDSHAEAKWWCMCVLELVRLGELESAEMMLTKGIECASLCLSFSSSPLLGRAAGPLARESLKERACVADRDGRRSSRALPLPPFRSQAQGPRP